MDWFPDWAPSITASALALLVVDLVVRLTAIAVVPVNRRPSSALAWLLAIFFIPYLGVLAFLLIGNPKLPRSRRRKQREINQLIVDTTKGMDLVSTDHPWPPWLTGVVELNRNLGAMPLVGGNSAQLVGEYDEAIRAMARSVDEAREYVHVEFYIMTRDATSEPFFSALQRAVQRGVKVRLLMDHIGSLRYPGYRRTVRFLREAGVEWHPMLPVQLHRLKYQRPDLRNHRKLLVVDGEVGWVGSQNVLDRSYNKRGNRRRGLQWQDLMVRLEGPIVSGVEALFITDWYSETDELLTAERPELTPVDPPGRLECQIVPSGPGFDGENNLKLFNALLYSAQRRISITSPYFVPDESMLSAITTAAERGVDVELFVSEHGDQAIVHYAECSYYENLLRAGVRIWRYPAPYVLHAKHMTVDEEVAVIGSSNMDMRSFLLDLELTLMVCGEEFSDDLRRVEDGYRARCTELTLEQWLARSRGAVIKENLARLTSALQ
ncbi:cardiolipin synthase [Kineococcus sp. T13]|uniref:cardiolipin synthase n=1 Tax=Kineococcus vitellinus TaxID=2696565 RepID=UPI001411E7A7|nr:cardiolipin synthase [Kineococcus vitellinus]